jgi:SAM-dependent methyltransferase
MAAWSDGYFTDVPYTAHFYGHMAPASIAFACLRQGVRPPELGPGATYLDLGCGQGFGLNLLAAANPGMRFWGTDFNPVHIANAQRLARGAELANVTFDDLSFEQLLELPEDRIPKCDVVALHGVYSWVSPANRALIVRILERHVKPGGLVAISYNVLPGWTQLMPLRRLLKADFDRAAGDPAARALTALRAAQEMIGGGAAAFSPKAATMLKQALSSTPAYVIHEYMNDHFHPLYHADVAQELDAARLTFAASASIAEDLPSLAAPPKLQAVILGETDSIRRETLMDYANDRAFRRDIFVRGRNPLTPAEQQALLSGVSFSLAALPGEISLSFQIPLGTLTGDPKTYGAVIEALTDGPRGYDDLAALPAFRSAAAGETMKVLGLLIEAGAISPTAQGLDAAGGAKAFNRALLRQFTRRDMPSHLAAGAAATGVRVKFTDLLALSAADDAKPDFPAAARRGWEMLHDAGASLTLEGQALSGEADHQAALIRHFEAFEKTQLPTFRRLGVI